MTYHDRFSGTLSDFGYASGCIALSNVFRLFHPALVRKGVASMAVEKHYVIDTNVLLDDPGALFKLRNGSENNVYIPYNVHISSESR